MVQLGVKQLKRRLMMATLAIENLWGELPEIESARTPYNILLEQAVLLREITKTELIGEVERSAKRHDDNDLDFVLDLLIFAPSLKYSYNVLSVFHGMTMYPLKIASSTGKSYQCQNEAEFIKALKEILSDKAIKKIISSLLTQIQADKKPLPLNYTSSVL